MITALSRPYASHEGVPVITHVDTDIFVLTYFMDCMKCDFCHDSCCGYGADTDVKNVRRLQAHAAGLGAYVGLPPEGWFQPGSTRDRDYPGGRYTRTRVRDGSCVFLNRSGRGCLIHRYCMEQGIDFHQLKPLVCSLFPLTFDAGRLFPSAEILDGSLQCRGPGPTLYRGARADIGHYFGPELIAELDVMEKQITGAAAAEKPEMTLRLRPAKAGELQA
jgi:Fe-S-cluster containining protein